MGALVSAVLVVRNGARWLAECLDGIAAQTVPPARLMIIDLASTDTSAAIAQAHSRVRRAVADVRIHRMDHAVPIGRAIDAAVDLLGEPVGVIHTAESDTPRGGAPPEWIWVLHDNCAPGPATLARLLAAVRKSPSVGIAGPKVVDWDDSRRLVSLGIQVTRSGRRIASPLPGEADQGQHDRRTDVLAVSTCGMLLRRDVHADLAGFDPAFEDAGAELDLGWRAQLAGHRVIVVPEAAVRASSADGDRDPATPTLSADADGRTRRAARQVALARCSWLALPFLALWIAVSAVGAALLLLVAKRPRAAWRELGDVAALLRPAAVLGARWRGRRTRRLRRSDLSTLFVSPTAAARSTLDHIQDVITPERTRAAREAAPTTETGPTSDEAEALGALPPALPQRIATHPGFLAVVTMLVMTAAAWRDAIRDGALSPTRTGVAGGELRPVATDSSGLWHAFRDSWHGSGLGSSAEPSPHLAVLSGLTWVAELLPGVSDSRSSAGLTAAWLLFLAPILSVGSAYLAARVVPAGPVARAVIALAWGASTVVTTAVSDGRLTAALGHVLLPFVLAGYALAARRHGTFTATFATALATGLLGAFVPPLLAVSSIAALGLLLLGPGSRRLRALVLLLVPPALLGTWVGTVVEDWRHLLSGPGLVSTAEAPEPWRLVLGQAETLAARSTTSAGEALAAVAERPVVALWAAGPLVMLGLLGYAVRRRNRAEGVGLAVAGGLGLVGLAAALTSGRVVLGSAETGVGVSETAYPWSGIGLELWTASLLVGLLVGSRVVVEGPDRRPQPAGARGWHAVGRWSLAGLVVVPVLVLVGTWGVSGASRTLTVGEATLPAVAVEQSHDPLNNRLLLLRPSAEVVDFVLSGREPGDLLRDLDRTVSADDRPLVDAVARLVGGRSADQLDASELADWAIGFVQVRADSAAPLVRRLDATQGLTRLGASEHGILWKVLPPPVAPGGISPAAPSRLRIVDGEGRLVAAVPTNGPHGAADESIPPAPDPASGPRRLVVAEPAEWSQHAVVLLDGRRLEPVTGQPQPVYDLPPAGGQLRVDLAAAQPWWRLAQGLVLAVVVFMALPFGNRRSRRPQP
ncbi:glycosyltransferase family 2 protein [Intrasporangium sp.]|uniref:glycosyltransferase family 2 protein n=1 Tax=Intrasporangium sp. TaxID=1925024 RepID=UPI002939A15D|nr:glycosyltransferase family 2 protein [Intrasporangium sp.]MDV3220026.1 glycosyltransferase family 2 protein [Intrasporangium sp.]